MNPDKAIRRRCRLSRRATRRLQAGALWLLAVFGAEFRGQGAEYSEYEVKAAVLSNFTQFVKWPAKAFPDAGAPFLIGVLGDDPFGAALERVVEGQSVAGHKIAIRRGRTAEDVKNCHLVFISKSENARLAESIGALQGATVLTVGEAEQFTRLGGVIGLTMEGRRVRFSINPAAAQRAGLVISSQIRKLDSGAQ